MLEGGYRLIAVSNVEVIGWEYAIRGMRNPMNSWNRIDSNFGDEADIGTNDLSLMMSLAKGGSTHAKYRRMIVCYLDIVAPLYWWKEFDTYKVGTVANSCSTMHKIHTKRFEVSDFSHDKLTDDNVIFLGEIVKVLNRARDNFLETKDKKWWWQMIQMLPSSYNQRRTVMLNYEVLAHIYHDRKNHKLSEWRNFCRVIEGLPHSEIITIDHANKEGE